jgi:hypothetical protein
MMIHKAKFKLESLTFRGMKLLLLHVSLNATAPFELICDMSREHCADQDQNHFATSLTRRSAI